MRILLTGSEGFIGRHVLKRLEGHEVVRVDPLEPRVHGEGASTPEGVLKRSSGFLFTDELEGFDVVIHLGAQVGVADSMTDPNRYVMGNSYDTSLLLSKLAQTESPPSRIVVASSMSVYGDPHIAEPIGEEWFTQPASVYGLTKLDQEILTLTLAPLMGAVPVALRFFNVFGPGQALNNPYTGVLANFARRILDGQAPIVYEDGLQTRDFIYVEDVADAVVHAATSGDLEGVYNVCTGRPQTILGVAEGMVDALGGRAEPDVTHEIRPGDIRHCIGRNLRLRLVFPEWEPRSFEEGLTAYAAWLIS